MSIPQVISAVEPGTGSFYCARCCNEMANKMDDEEQGRTRAHQMLPDGAGELLLVLLLVLLQLLALRSLLRRCGGRTGPRPPPGDVAVNF